MFSCLFGMISRMQVMAMCDVCMMRCLFVIASFIMLSCLTMMTRSMLMMFSSFVVVFCPFVFCHSHRDLLVGPQHPALRAEVFPVKHKGSIDLMMRR
jgi:hypothetical protein